MTRLIGGSFVLALWIQAATAQQPIFSEDLCKKAGAIWTGSDCLIATSKGSQDLPPFQAQLDRIEAILLAICERQSIGQPTAGYATQCPSR